MKILADFHHQDLYYSLQLLFEKRLGHELYRPIGLEWYEQGYWHVFPHIGTAKQYLATDQAINTPVGLDGPFPQEKLLNRNYRIEDGIYYVEDPSKQKFQRGITLDKFRDMEFDILISSIPQHIQPFNKLIREHHPRAKHIFQVGNAWGHQLGVSNILASTAPFPVPQGINVVFYHQEFDLNIYKYIPPTNHRTIYSYIHYMREMHLFEQYKSNLPEYTFKTHGAGMDEDLHTSELISDRMAQSAFTWHVKPEGDGFGHTIFNTYACGRPAIIKANYYRGKKAEHLLQDGITCIDISKRGMEENLKLIRAYSHPEEHLKMCEAAHTRFREVVDYDAEEVKIRAFLNQLI